MDVVELTLDEKRSFLNKLNDAFDDGFDFEEFLEQFFKIYGLKEIVITKKTGDGGVDLEAIRPGVFEDNRDNVIYKIQAKKYKPGTTVGVSVIDRHLGILKSGEVGIIITTGKFSEDAKKASERKPENPIILIDGDKLIDFCIQNQIGFVYRPVFSKIKLKEFYKSEKNKYANEMVSDENLFPVVEKKITSNDIRAKIIGIPHTIYNMLPSEKETFDLVINGTLIKNAKINRERKYFSKGLSKIYKEYNLVTEDNVYNPCEALWSINNDKIIIQLNI